MNKLDECLIKKIKQYRKNNSSTKQITDSSIGFYASRVRILYEKFGGKLELLDYLNNFSKVIKDNEKKYPDIKTQCSSFHAIIAVLEAYGGNHESIGKYKEKIKEFVIEIVKDKDCERNEKEEENWITSQEILDKMSGLERSLPSKEGKDLFDTYQQYLVLNLYTLIPPIRNNFVDVLVYEKEVCMKEDKNYIFLKDNKLILNNYKTKGKYGASTINLPDKLVEIIRTWMKLRVQIYKEIEDNHELLFNTKVITPMVRRNFSKYIHRILGKNVSVQMLRKIYLSEKYPVNHSGAEMKEDARIMGHSIQTQQTVYRKRT